MSFSLPLLRPRLVPVTAAIVLTWVGGAAEPAPAQSLDLRSLLTDFIEQGITLAKPPVGVNHEAHFFGDVEEAGGAFQAMNTELAGALSTLPLTSSAGGFAYTFDPELGVFNRRSKSFGPIYAERPLTVGKGRFNFGLNYSVFTFDRLDDVKFNDGSLKLVFRHTDTNNDGSNLTPFVEGDLVTAAVYMDVRSTVSTFVATYGVSDRLDLGMAVPEVSVDIDLSADARVLRLATADTLSDTHRFPNGTDRQTLARSGSATGLGDVAFRAKYRAIERRSALLALSGELRIPTGEEENLLGSGAFQFSGGVITALNRDGISPHATLAYGIGGNDLPSEISYAAGFDWSVDPRLTVAADLLGRYRMDVSTFEIVPKTYQANRNGAPDGPVRLVSQEVPGVVSKSGRSRNLLDGSIGFKFNLAGSLLMTANGRFQITRAGLSDGFTPLVGFDYSF